MVRAEVISDPHSAAAVVPGWRSLAIENARPYCAPEWMLAWWRHVAPRDADLRIVVASEGSEVIGVAPLYVHGSSSGAVRYRLLAAGTSLRGDFLATPGREPEVAGAFAVALQQRDGAGGLVAFEGTVETSRWPSLLCAAWTQSRPSRLFREWAIKAPVLQLRGSYEDWFASRSSNFRQQMRRARGKLDRAGATFRIARTQDELEGDIAAFAALHYSRWDDRGGSRALTSSIEAMLLDAGRDMVDSGRFRLWSLVADGRIVSSHLFMAAGGEVSYWLGGFDDRYASFKPSLQVLLAALEDAWSRGDTRFDLGGGDQDYKRRFTDESETLEWTTVVPPGLRHMPTRAALRLVPARRRLLGKLSPKTQARLRRLVRRG